MLTQVQESIFQVSFDLLLDALQHVIGAVALVPFKYFKKKKKKATNNYYDRVTSQRYPRSPAWSCISHTHTKDN